MLFRSVGYQAGQSLQGDYSVSVGNNAGQKSQGIYAVAVGQDAGEYSQGPQCISIGTNAGQYYQYSQSVSIGYNAGEYYQGTQSIVIGYQAGQYSFPTGAVAIGAYAGQGLTGSTGYFGYNSIAIGYNSNVTNGATGSVAIGYNSLATQSNQIVLGTVNDTVYCPGGVTGSGGGPTGGGGSGYGLQKISLIATNYIIASGYGQTSDYRIKENVQDLDDTFNVDNLRPVSYLNTSTYCNDIGFIADEVQNVYPQLVNGIKDEELLQSVNYNGLIGVLVKEIQRLKTTVTKLSAQVEGLMGVNTTT